MFFSVLVVAGCPPLSEEAGRGFEVIKAIRALTAPGVITISVSQRGKLPVRRLGSKAFKPHSITIIHTHQC